MFEFYYTKVVTDGEGDSLAWLWNIVFPFITFLLGILIPMVISTLHQRKKERKAAVDFVTEIQLLEEPIRKQLHDLNMFLQEQSDAEYTLPDLTVHRALILERLRAHERAVIVEHFARVKGGRTVAVSIANRLFSGCDLVTQCCRDLETLAGKYEQRFRESVGTYSRLLNEWQQVVQKLIRDSQNTYPQPEEDAFIVGLMKFLDIVSINVDKGPNFFFHQIHTPLGNYTAEHSRDDRIVAVAEINRQMRYVLIELNMLRRDMVEKFVGLRQELEDDARTMLEAVVELDAKDT